MLVQQASPSTAAQTGPSFSPSSAPAAPRAACGRQGVRNVATALLGTGMPHVHLLKCRKISTGDSGPVSKVSADFGTTPLSWSSDREICKTSPLPMSTLVMSGWLGPSQLQHAAMAMLVLAKAAAL